MRTVLLVVAAHALALSDRVPSSPFRRSLVPRRVRMTAHRPGLQAALVGSCSRAQRARPRCRYRPHAVFRLRGEARELGFSGLRLLPGRALLRVGHPDLGKILLVGGADPVFGSTRRVRSGPADSRWTARAARRSDWEPQLRPQIPPVRPEDSRWRGSWNSHDVSWYGRTRHLWKTPVLTIRAALFNSQRLYPFGKSSPIAR